MHRITARLPACRLILARLRLGTLILNREGLLLVVSGPSGVGKGTVISHLQERHTDLVRSVSCTTRLPRPGEDDGVHYHFVLPADFAQMRAEHRLLESATVHHDISYGTPREPVETALAQGRDVILEIDYQGARSVRHIMGGKAVLVFIASPSGADLEQRLRSRPAGASDDVERRLETATRELANLDLFQYVVVNHTGQVERAVNELEAILLAERCRLCRNDWRNLL